MSEPNERAENGALPDSTPQNQIQLPQASPFSSNTREILSALFSYVLAYLYVDLIFSNTVRRVYGYLIFSYYVGRQGILFLIFVAGFTAWELLYTRGRKRPWESWIWLICLWVITFVTECKPFWNVIPLRVGRIWSDSVWIWLFVHCFAVYWVLCCTGKLVKGRSSHFLPLDALNGAIIFPFKHYALKIRSLWWGLTHRKRSCKGSLRRVGYALLALCIAAIFLYIAGGLLMQADSTFQALLGDLRAAIGLERLLNSTVIMNFLFRFLLSLPVGSYLNSLIAGSMRETPETLQRQSCGVSSFLAALQKIPGIVWNVLLGVFVLFYLAFFAIQAGYLFGAILHQTAPGVYTLAEYARQGFFELCKIMALNFALLWVVVVSSEVPVRSRLLSKAMCTLLLGESILFAVTAFSKLYLYISAFGFTPLRFQSAWLICVLLAGCVCTLIYLWSGKNTARAWVLFTGVSLTLTMLY